MRIPFHHVSQLSQFVSIHSNFLLLFNQYLPGTLATHGRYVGASRVTIACHGGCTMILICGFSGDSLSLIEEKAATVK